MRPPFDLRAWRVLALVAPRPLRKVLSGYRDNKLPRRRQATTRGR